MKLQMRIFFNPLRRNPRGFSAEGGSASGGSPGMNAVDSISASGRKPRTLVRGGFTFLVSLLPALVLSACVFHRLPPPAPKIEVVNYDSDTEGKAWVPGRWVWKGKPRGYIWVPGHWK